MSWNYRVVKYRAGGYGLHEVYYNEDGAAWSMTLLPAGFVGDDEAEVKEGLANAFVDAASLPVFEEPEVWVPRDNAHVAREVREDGDEG